MRSVDRKSAARRPSSLHLMVLSLLVLGLAGCGPEKDGSDGIVITTQDLSSNTLLNLHCEDAGIGFEQCVLDDPDNPFLYVAIIEFNENNPGAENKFQLEGNIPDGPAYAKTRFYFWATALARTPIGENQYYTALALHELYDANADTLIRDQAIKAYRSVLDNFWGSVTFFGPFGAAQVFVPQQLNLLVADKLYRPAATGYAPLFATPLEAEAAMGEWGYDYIPCSVDCPNDGQLYRQGGG